MHGQMRHQGQQQAVQELSEMTPEGRGKALREFRDHAVSFFAVNGGLLALNLVTDPHYLWALWPLFGWGIGFVSHAAKVWPLLRAERDRGATPLPPPLTLASEAERERPWPDLEER